MMKRMSSIKKKKKKGVETPNVTMYQSIPEDVKISFGKFYAYSLIYILFFGILYPWFLMYYLNTVFTIIVFIVLIILYGLMIYDIKKKTGKFISTMFFILIVLVLVSISFSIIKLII